MKIQPLADRVLINPVPAEEVTVAGIIIPDSAKEKPLKGQVLAVGGGTKDEVMVVKEGDTVLYGKYAGTEIDVKGEKLLMPDSLFIYGEVLQDKNVKETEYAEYMDMTASNYGHALREALAAGNFNAADLLSWHHPVDPKHLVTWVESHDTYCNFHESAGLTDDQIRAGWVFLTARDGGRPLFYSRPAGSTRENYWGNNRIGARGNDEFFHPEVVAVNKFRHAMTGEPEAITVSDNGAIAEVSRGTRGVVLVNFSNQPQEVDMATPLSTGKYTDGVHGTEFTVEDGAIHGAMAPNATYILYSEK